MTDLRSSEKPEEITKEDARDRLHFTSDANQSRFSAKPEQAEQTTLMKDQSACEKEEKMDSNGSSVSDQATCSFPTLGASGTASTSAAGQEDGILVKAAQENRQGCQCSSETLPQTVASACTKLLCELCLSKFAECLKGACEHQSVPHELNETALRSVCGKLVNSLALETDDNSITNKQVKMVEEETQASAQESVSLQTSVTKLQEAQLKPQLSLVTFEEKLTTEDVRSIEIAETKAEAAAIYRRCEKVERTSTICIEMTASDKRESSEKPHGVKSSSDEQKDQPATLNSASRMSIAAIRALSSRLAFDSSPSPSKDAPSTNAKTCAEVKLPRKKIQRSPSPKFSLTLGRPEKPHNTHRGHYKPYQPPPLNIDNSFDDSPVIDLPTRAASQAKSLLSSYPIVIVAPKVATAINQALSDDSRSEVQFHKQPIAPTVTFADEEQSPEVTVMDFAADTSSSSEELPPFQAFPFIVVDSDSLEKNTKQVVEKATSWHALKPDLEVDGSEDNKDQGVMMKRSLTVPMAPSSHHILHVASLNAFNQDDISQVMKKASKEGGGRLVEKVKACFQVSSRQDCGSLIPIMHCLYSKVSCLLLSLLMFYPL